MLPKENRVDKKLFDQVFEKGKVYHSDFLYLKLLELPNKEKVKFSFVVPKKVAKGAVKRIFLRRKGYAILRDSMKKIKKGFGGIFFLKKGSEKLEFEDYKKEIKNLLKKSDLNIL